MKKIGKIIIGIWIAILILAIGQNSLAENKLATLILPETGTKKIVEVNSSEANHYFDLGYHLMTNLLGASFTPTTAYAERLSISAASNATTIYVSSVLDRDGIVLPLSANNKGYFTLEPGTSREESIVCTAASSTTNTLSGCTRGLAASGSDETGSSARAYSHNAGSKIIMTDIAQFFGNFVDITNAQTIGGNKTFTGSTNFTSLPTTSTSTPTLEQQIATKRYVDQSVIAGGVIGTETVPGIWEGATQAEMARGIGTSTYSGTDYNLLLQSKYASSTSSATTTIPITNVSGKIDSSFIATSTNYNLYDQTFNGTTTFTGTVNGVTNLASSSVLVDVATGTATIIDQVVILGYQPSLITLDYWIQGHTGSGASVYQQQKGRATFKGDGTIISNNIFWNFQDSNDDAAVSGSDIATADFSMNKTPVLVATTTVGTTANTGGKKMSIYIANASSTGFTLRSNCESGASPNTSLICRAKMLYSVIK